jgi:hypothetical protein
VETCDTYLSLTSEFKKAQSYSVLLFPYAGDITDRGQSGWGNKTGYYPNAGAVEVGDNFPPETEAMAYDMSQNILAWDYSAARADLNLVKISKIYDVFSTYINSIMNFYSMTVAITGRPWLEVGDVVVVELPVRDVYGRFLDSNGNVTENFDDAQKLTYQTTVFTRTLSGTRALTDKITAKGES